MSSGIGTGEVRRTEGRRGERKVREGRRRREREGLEKRERKGREKGPLRTHRTIDGVIEKKLGPWGVRRINGGNKTASGQQATRGY